MRNELQKFRVTSEKETRNETKMNEKEQLKMIVKSDDDTPQQQ